PCASKLAYSDLPVKFAEHTFDARRCILIELESLAVKARPAPVASFQRNSAGRHGLDEVPVVIAAHEPAETDLRIIEQVLFPVITHALEFDAALHKADHSEPRAVELAC